MFTMVEHDDVYIFILLTQLFVVFGLKLGCSRSASMENQALLPPVVV